MTWNNRWLWQIWTDSTVPRNHRQLQTESTGHFRWSLHCPHRRIPLWPYVKFLDVTHDRVTKLLSTKSKAWSPITCCCFVIFLIIRGDTVVIFNSNLFSMVRKVDYDRLFVNHNCTAMLWLSIWQEMDTRKWASFSLYWEFLASQKKKEKKKTSWNIVVLCLTICLRHRNSKCCFFLFCLIHVFWDPFWKFCF